MAHRIGMIFFVDESSQDPCSCVEEHSFRKHCYFMFTRDTAGWNFLLKKSTALLFCQICICTLTLTHLGCSILQLWVPVLEQSPPFLTTADIAGPPSFVGTAISFAFLRILSVIGLIALSHCSSMQPKSQASLILGFTPLLITTGSPLL